MSSPASLKHLLLGVFKVTGQQSSCQPVQALAKTQPRDSRTGSDDMGERHRRSRRILLVTTLRAGEEGVLGYAPARKRRGWGRGSAQLCRCHRDGFPGSRHSVATSRAFPPPTCGTGRQWLSPKRSSCTCSFVLTGTECGFSVCNIHQKPKALQICLAGRVPFSRR